MFTHMQAVWRFRHFWLSLVRMDLRTRYRRSALGIGWSVLNPVLMSVVLVLGFGKVLGRSSMWDYGAFLLPGLCTWEFLRNSVTIGSDALTHNEAYIRQCPMPYAIYPLRTVLGTGVHYIITLVVTIILNMSVFAIGGHQDPLAVLSTIWCLPAIGAILFVFAWGGATLSAFASAYFPDVKYLIEVTATMLFFLTPIMIPIQDMTPILREVSPYNPVFHFLELIRHPLYYGVLPPVKLWLTCAGMAAVAFAAGCLTVRMLARKVVFQL